MSIRISKSARQQRILEEVRSRPQVRSADLADRFDVTHETIRRDLEELEAKGVVLRTYGGVVARPRAFEPEVVERERTLVSERIAIAETAARLIRSGEIVMIDSGATTSIFAARLAPRAKVLTVITNRPAIAEHIGNHPGHKVLLCPGAYSHSERGVFGQETTAFLERYNANTAVIGAGGLAPRGVTDVHNEACWVKRAMIERSDRTILLVDHSKFSETLLETVCPLTAISDVIVDAPPAGELARALEEAGVTVHVAGTDMREAAGK